MAQNLSSSMGFLRSPFRRPNTGDSPARRGQLTKRFLSAPLSEFAGFSPLTKEQKRNNVPLMFSRKGGGDAEGFRGGGGGAGFAGAVHRDGRDLGATVQPAL